MSTPVSANARPLGRVWLSALVGFTLVLIICALLLVGNSRYRSCIERAEAEFPAVPVSAFSGRATGPLKVSFVAERNAALKQCGGFH